jgi:hypothetical protein
MIPVPDNAPLFGHVAMVCHNHGGEAVADNDGQTPVNDRFDLFFVYPVSDRVSLSELFIKP